MTRRPEVVMVCFRIVHRYYILVCISVLGHAHYVQTAELLLHFASNSGVICVLPYYPIDAVITL
jgi:arginine exporter protein ArgO